jgi:HSP20 family protein
MADVSQALKEVKELYTKVLGEPAPQVEAPSFVAFPPGVDPVRHAVEEVALLKQLSEQMQQLPTWIPRADLFAGRDLYVLRVEVPGVSREQVKVYLSGAECVVVGERRPPEPDVLRPLSLEAPFGRFERRFPVPMGLRPEQLTASVREGVLELRLTLDPTPAPKVTSVDVA